MLSPNKMHCGFVLAGHVNVPVPVDSLHHVEVKALAGLEAEQCAEILLHTVCHRMGYLYGGVGRIC